MVKTRVKIFSRNLIICVVALCICLLVAQCSDSKDRGDGFKSTKTEPTQVTIPSKTPTLKQPCSLVTSVTAASLLGTTVKKLGNPEASEPEQNTLRCRYAATSDDKKFYLVLNIYVYEKQDAYDLVEKVNGGKKIQTTVDDGFYFIKTTKIESERFVAARSGKSRIGVSSSIALINPGTLKQEEIQLPDINMIATQVGLILSKI